MGYMDTLTVSWPAKKQAAPLAPQGHPIFLLVGSLSGCSKKDALQYARGLAEQNIITPSAGRIQVYQDKARDRWVYEIHEGGIEFSIAEKVVAALDAGEPVRIALVNGAHLSIEEAHGELFSLVNPQLDDDAPAFAAAAQAPQLDFIDATSVAAPEFVDDPAPVAKAPDDISKYAGTTPLQEVFPMNKQLSKTGGWLLGVGGVCFASLGLAFALMHTGVFDSDALLTLAKSGVVADASDNPALQLEKARAEAEKTGAHITALKKGPKGWSWELSQ